jgi:hypothetical protein
MGVGDTYLPPLLFRVDETEEASMGREDGTLTLQGLARRLGGALKRDNAELRSKVASEDSSAKSLRQ